jgi:hypothetical protein
LTKPERMYVNKHCVFHCSKSKIIHGRTPLQIIIYLSITIVLINGCFHNGLVICPRLVIMLKEGCIGLRQQVLTEIVDYIENITWLFPYHIPYQHETPISVDIGRGLIRDVMRKEPYHILLHKALFYWFSIGQKQ